MKRVESVAVIITNDQDEVLLLQRGPQAANLHGKWESIGGKVHDGETHEEAAIREAMEEAGLEIEIEQQVIEGDYPVEEASATFHSIVFTGRIISGEPKIGEPEKCSAIRWVKKSDLTEMDLAWYTADDFQKFGWI
ncbi:MAG: NUDIX hydrolase [Candidatus Saccharimonadales bacterium]|nr:NUDIX hydrolase [Candidatus Saccharimonadales bacterium]